MLTGHPLPPYGAPPIPSVRGLWCLVFAVLFLLISCSDSGEPSHLYVVCRCRPGVADCQDSLTWIASTSTERCGKGATLEVICTGAGCPSIPGHRTAPDGGTP